jgi:hypothetical protein
MIRIKIFFVLFFFSCWAPLPLFSQGIVDNSGQAAPAQGFAAATASQDVMPLKRVVILTSGLAYYEHQGSLNGAAGISLPFKIEAVNDALKTLIISDPSSSNPSVTYQSENTLLQTLKSLTIDLSGEPSLSDILSKLRGAEVEIITSSTYTGRIAGVDNRSKLSMAIAVEPWLLLNTADGIRSFDFKEISSIKFKDPVIEQDLSRALDLLAASRNSSSRLLTVNLPGTGRRNVTLSYVIPSPVWKVSYRLDLGASKPLFQGWAIVDNDSDTDWNNVRLSLVTGRPTSFIQALYPPYYVNRPVLPLSIAGTAEAAAHDQGVSRSTPSLQSAPSAAQRMAVEESYLQESIEAMLERERARLTTAAGSAAGGQFEFTIKNPVSLDRRMSAMLPLVETEIQARKTLIYSSGTHPRLGAEITNSSGMKLPAGPVTVYDGGVYGGDALLDFWNENDKRLISFGEDLTVTASSGSATANVISTVVIANGVMTINRTQTFNASYTFINSDSSAKNMIVEKTKTANTTLVSPAAYEQTTNAYRFNVTLAAKDQTVLTVSEQRPLSERVTLVSLRPETIVSYSTNQEIPQRVRDALARAIDLRREVEAAEQAVKETEAQQSRLIADQDRIRRNLEAAGNQTQQGQEYLRRLVALDGEIDTITPVLEKQRENLKTAQNIFTNYLGTLNL